MAGGRLRNGDVFSVFPKGLEKSSMQIELQICFRFKRLKSLHSVSDAAGLFEVHDQGRKAARGRR